VGGWLLLCLAGMVLAPLGAASAQPAVARSPRRFVLVTRATGSDRALADEAAEAIASELDARGLTVESPPAPAEPIAADLSPVLASAADAYAHLRLDEARALLDSLFAALDRTGGAGLARSDLVRAWVLAAGIARATGEEPAVLAALDAALAIDPALTLDPALEPPPIVLALEERRAAIRSCALELTTEPSDAAVVIDGSERTRGHLDLPCGLHLVRVDAPLHVATGRRVVLDDPEQPSALHVSLELDVAAAFAAPGAPFSPIPASLSEAAAHVASGLLVLDISRTADGVARARLVGLDRERDASSTEEGDAIARALLEEREPAPAVDPWPWVGLGVGLAALVGGAIAIGVAVSSAPGDTGFGVRGTVAP
jgi:hypothetical protein